jgi:hypothetical protein
MEVSGQPEALNALPLRKDPPHLLMNKRATKPFLFDVVAKKISLPLSGIDFAPPSFHRLLCSLTFVFCFPLLTTSLDK